MFSNSSVVGSLLVIFTLGGCVSNGLNNSADPRVQTHSNPITDESGEA
jgi:hypothetical protein